MTAHALLHGLPGEQLVREGVGDVVQGRATIPALVVSVARGRLTRAGVLPHSAPQLSPDPERDLYRQLLRESPDAYSRYNALLRELASFLSALDHRRSRLSPEG